MAYYYVTYKCTARCTFCNIPDGPMDVIPVSKYSSTAQSIEQFKILKSIGVRLIDFTGGEPLLKKNLPTLLKAAKDMGLQTQMTTNCTLYPRRAKELAGPDRYPEFLAGRPYRRESTTRSGATQLQRRDQEHGYRPRTWASPTS